MRRVKSWSLFALIGTFMISLLLPHGAWAGTDTVVTLGKDLTADQRQTVMRNLEAPDGVETLEVSIQDVERYLGNHVDKATIGTKAYSSAKVTLAKEGSGIRVDTTNVTKITPQMYANALITAGVKDAEVTVTAPIQVSGTTGLTGIMMAFETATDQEISDEQKDLANEEMVITSELGEKIEDSDKATQFIAEVKEEIAEQQPQTKEEVRDIIINVAGDLNINLGDQDVDRVTDTMHRFSELDIDWNSLGNQLNELKNNFDEMIGNIDLDSEEAQGFLSGLLDWLSELWDAITSVFATE
ncbi:DUF1002 domain-containing protein [Desmospora profundinema]|uniref:Uncharacterized protein YpuA (DUF1002 family) n=1 Tax=Desmospora profundinema TaxID=1571184 RepID=A0ABU1INX0_9BACL|nr:DUF1002 domain-containing protein [Desmospora profundinema]MDR6226486.1 uncharacterized protein YpuA (DUF1002 family) [Desmospora profundinema]